MAYGELSASFRWGRGPRKSTTNFHQIQGGNYGQFSNLIFRSYVGLFMVVLELVLVLVLVLVVVPVPVLVLVLLQMRIDHSCKYVGAPLLDLYNTQLVGGRR